MAYIQEFPNDTETQLNASTEKHAKICWEELGDPSIRQQRQLSYSAAKYGSVAAMEYLRSVNCEWDEMTCATAAKYGQWNVLQWCKREWLSVEWNDLFFCSKKWPFRHINSCP